MSSFDALFARVAAAPCNQRILARLCQSTTLRPGSDGCGYDEGAAVFFWRWGERIPDEAKFDLGYSHLMIRPETARIFAAQEGRFTFLIRPDWSLLDLSPCPRCGALDCDRRRRGATLDGDVDAAALGRAWALLSRIADEDEDALLWRAYVRAGAPEV
ncbi:MAG: hypothetical protein R3A79_04815 [Nannocystaceae bacterium]